MSVDMERVSRLIAEAAAEEMLPRRRNLTAAETREKGPGDLVTVVDEAMERRLTRAFRDLLPGSDVVGEEACAADLSLLDRFSSPGPIWVIDPLDGTANFVSGAPDFAVIVALVQDDAVRAAWIHEPLRGETLAAEAGAGAWRAGARIATPAPPDGLDALVGVVSARHMPPEERARLTPLQAALPRRRGLFCAGAEYAGLARGERHYSVFYRLMPWDHAAGALIVTEAGGRVALLGAGGEAEPYRPSRTVGALMAAASPALWDRLAGHVALG